MIRPTTFISLIVLGVLVFAVFQVEHRVEMLRSELNELNRQVDDDKNVIHVLKAEWSYLNSPIRIEELADKYLELDYVDTVQISDIENIPMSNLYVSEVTQNWLMSE